jgi:hypothetical protein
MIIAAGNWTWNMPAGSELRLHLLIDVYVSGSFMPEINPVSATRASSGSGCRIRFCTVQGYLALPILSTASI